VVAIGEAKHVFSHIIWLMRGFVITVKEPLDNFLWVSKDDLTEQYSIPSAFSFFLNYFLDR
ncbi:MAG: A/G-specific adenine glycosylase, partial [Bacilli bacterium]|nr:A/G-specific adenine glycosylase [Bacilli bacterium]